MTQNRSTAVMQRRVEPHDSLDDFPTMPWATRALCEYLTDNLFFVEWDRTKPPRKQMSAREPAANRGHMVKPLREYFATVEASDIFDYGVGFPHADYLFGPDPAPVDWTITNPPFRLAEQFIERMYRTSREGCAVIVRSAFLEGVGRFERLFCKLPPTHVLQFAERVVMHKGKLSPNGSTATAYCWLIWDKRGELGRETRFDWIRPCRRMLERPDDYPEAS